MEGYSLADIATAANAGEGFGGNGGLWILIILFFLIGMGGNGWNRTGELGQYATAASQQEILFGQRFDALATKINQIGDGLCSSTYALNNAITGEGRAIQTQLAQLNSNIENKFAALEKSTLEQRIAEQAAQINQLQLQTQLGSVVRYPTNSAWAMSGNPFCGNGCGCGNI